MIGGMSRARGAAVAILVALLVAPACEPAPDPVTTVLDDDAITIGSFNFPESVLLAELYALALGRAGFNVNRELDLGPREFVAPAVIRGLVELVPEYSGSALEFLEGSASPDPGATHEALADALEERGLAALDPAPAEDRNGFVMTAATAQDLDVRTLSELVPFSPDLTFGGPPECPSRPLCLLGLERAYGMQFGAFVPLDEGGPLTVAALRSGEVDVALLFTSAGAIETNGFVLLEDDGQLQPAENVTPVIRSEVLERFGVEVADVLNAMSARLTTSDLRRMNAAVTAGASPRSVATTWLREHGPDEPLG
jgi:osmoprotectant transport system substrate-binding protein